MKASAQRKSLSTPSNAPWLAKDAMELGRISASSLKKDVTSEVCGYGRQIFLATLLSDN